MQAVKIGDEDQSVRGRESRNVVVAELVASLLQAMVVELGDQAGAKKMGWGGGVPLVAHTYMGVPWGGLGVSLAQSAAAERES